MNEYYNEGYAAFSDGLDYSDNPYPGDSTRCEEWADGWTAASLEDAGEEISNEEKYADWM